MVNLDLARGRSLGYIYDGKEHVNFMKKKNVVVLFSAMLMFGIFMTGCSGSGAPVNHYGGSRSEDGSNDDLGDGSTDDSSVSGLGELKSFEAKTLDGETFTQDDLAKKDVTVINFWSVGCGPCVDEMPEIAELAKSLPDNVQIITVNFDGQRGKSEVERILDEAGFEGITLVSGNGDLAEVCGEIMYTPTTIFVDKDGNIVGDEIIGRQEDTREAFLAGINATLKSMGEEEIDNE